MRSESITHTIMQLSKEIEMYASEEEYATFPGADEIDLELEALGEYMTERMDRLNLEDSFLILFE